MDLTFTEYQFEDAAPQGQDEQRVPDQEAEDGEQSSG
jgi:hypothetical protein